ncbi:50S ribosomal protein L3 [Candidatus Saccharibacteria bacterium CG10_big_fil_rev_8_21_14_0_10_47_8]|nr:MAG: 50S ribosomal protein L3 [Candidatus Saccharibacteria bacterium CG10_big_fil_rev_8_21_14_0_10_47_8]
MKALITRKLGMTSVITEDGASIAVTLLSAEPNVITQLKNNDTDGYQAIQQGFETNRKLAKPQIGHSKAAKATPKIVREFRINEITDETKVGEKLSADLFSVGDTVSATGISKGKGFAGTIKRHNFHRGRKTHGGRSYRRPGSIGSMYPQKIFKGKKMAGRMGHDQVTTKGLKIALIEPDLNVIGITGAIPGPRKGIVLIREAKL